MVRFRVIFSVLVFLIGGFNSMATDLMASGAQSPLMAVLDQSQSDHDEEDGIIEPVKWTYSAQAVEGSPEEFDLVFKAKIDDHWHLYSQHLESDFGPLPTSFSFTDTTGTYQLIGQTKEGTPVVSWDPNFEMDLSYYNDSATFVQRIKWNEAGAGVVEGYLTFMSCDDKRCLPPEDIEFAIEIGYEKNYLLLFLGAFLSGFLALLTPCVFPMIPLTVSFFTKQSKTRSQGIRNALTYAFFIVFIYVALGVFVSAVFGEEVLNNMGSNPWFNLFFFALLIVFAASFLGAFEITLPSSWINKADTASNRGGIIGIFFMALVLAIVSFTCTGPIVGTLIVQAASGAGFMGPIIGMIGFSLALAIPFALFAMFPGWLNSLPQSGGWLNSVKVTLGFLELAFAFKFLSNADLVWDWHLIERELFIAIWIVIFGLLTLYLLGKLMLSHDSPITNLSVTRLMLAIVTGVFTIYLIPGLWGAPLKLIAAFPPPMHYSESPDGVGKKSTTVQYANTSDDHAGDNSSPREDTYLGPQGILAFHEYDKAMAHAKEVGKPLFLDFTGKTCVNCRKMEEQVWSDPEVRRILSEEVVMASLYVDDITPLPEEEQFTKTFRGKEIDVETVGDFNKLLEKERYSISTQPYYILLDHSENPLSSGADYENHGNVPTFKGWLRNGIDSFNSQK